MKTYSTQVKSKEKAKIMKEARKKLKNGVSKDVIAKLAAKWVQIVDQDGDGKLNFEEYQNFFDKFYEDDGESQDN